MFDRHGAPQQIKLIQHFESKCYRIHLSDHMEVTGNGALNFLLETPKYRIRSLEHKGRNKFRRPLKQLSVVEVADHPLKHRDNKLFFSIPTCEPLKLPYQDLPVPPFVFGFWYWNRTRKGQFTVKAINSKEVIEKFRSCGYKIIKPKESPDGSMVFSVSPSIPAQLLPLVPEGIPNNYLLAHEDQRLELLRGIVQAQPNQYKKKGDRFTFHTQNWLEVRKLQALVESLGCKTMLKVNTLLKYYSLGFRIRHVLCSYQDSPPIRIHQARRYITEVKELPSQQCVHIETNGPDGSFLVGEGFITCR